MTPSQKGMSSKRTLAIVARTLLLSALTLIGTESVFAKTPEDTSHPLAIDVKPATTGSKLKTLPTKLAQAVHLKKAKKAKPVDARMNSADAPGSVATGVSSVQLKKIPASKDKPEDVSVAQ
jgi:hypothetical protein